MNLQVDHVHPLGMPVGVPADSAVPARWRWHSRALRELRAQLLRQREERSAAFHVALERAGTDAADVALAQRENYEILAAISAQDAELGEVEAALGRLDDGTYGICHASGRKISAERLRAIPWTRFCKEVASAREGREHPRLLSLAASG